MSSYTKPREGIKPATLTTDQRAALKYVDDRYKGRTKGKLSRVQKDLVRVIDQQPVRVPVVRIEPSEMDEVHVRFLRRQRILAGKNPDPKPEPLVKPIDPKHKNYLVFNSHHGS